MTIQDRGANFRNDKGKLFLVRCYACNDQVGKENYSMAVASGQCAFCGWTEEKPDTAEVQVSKPTDDEEH